MTHADEQDREESEGDVDRIRHASGLCEQMDKSDSSDHCSFEQLAPERQPSLAREFWWFFVENKRWWLAPIVIALLLLSLIVVLNGTGAAPFIYTFF